CATPGRSGRRRRTQDRIALRRRPPPRRRFLRRSRFGNCPPVPGGVQTVEGWPCPGAYRVWVTDSAPMPTGLVRTPLVSYPREHVDARATPRGPRRPPAPGGGRRPAGRRRASQVVG